MKFAIIAVFVPLFSFRENEYVYYRIYKKEDKTMLYMVIMVGAQIAFIALACAINA